jgi:hypothetical protein
MHRPGTSPDARLTATRRANIRCVRDLGRVRAVVRLSVGPSHPDRQYFCRYSVPVLTRSSRPTPPMEARGRSTIARRITGAANKSRVTGAAAVAVSHCTVPVMRPLQSSHLQLARRWHHRRPSVRLTDSDPGLLVRID